MFSVELVREKDGSGDRQKTDAEGRGTDRQGAPTERSGGAATLGIRKSTVMVLTGDDRHGFLVHLVDQTMLTVDTA
jgi:hypothetical protein